MLNIPKLSLLSSNWNSGESKLDFLQHIHFPEAVRSTVSRGVNKRPYLDDCLPLASVFTMRNVSLQVVKASLLPANLVMTEYNKHVMECEQRDEDIDFDWKTCLEKNFVKFQYEAQKMICVSFIKKFVEEVCVNVCTPKIADKLTKNIGKSLVRKLDKFGRLVACQNIWWTYLWGNILSYSSMCIYDVGYKTVESFVHFFKTWKSKGLLAARSSVSIVELSKFVAKKLLFFSACWFSSSCGFSAGTLCNKKYGGTVGSLVFELVAATSISTILVI